MIDAGFELLAERFNPILDVFAKCGVQFALEGMIATGILGRQAGDRALEEDALVRAAKQQATLYSMWQLAAWAKEPFFAKVLASQVAWVKQTVPFLNANNLDSTALQAAYRKFFG